MLVGRGLQGVGGDQPVATVFLADIHQPVGQRDQGVAVTSFGWIDGDAYGAADLDVAVRRRNLDAKPFQDAFGDAHGLLPCLVRLPRKQQGELVATEPRHEIVAAQDGSKVVRHALQQRVAGLVAERVVDP